MNTKLFIFLSILLLPQYILSIDLRKDDVNKCLKKENNRFILYKKYNDNILWVRNKESNKNFLISDSSYKYSFDLYVNGNVIFLEKIKNNIVLKYYFCKIKKYITIPIPEGYSPDNPTFITKNQICFTVAEMQSLDPYPGYLYMYDMLKKKLTQLTDGLAYNLKSYKEYIIIFLENKEGEYQGVFMIDPVSNKMVKISSIAPKDQYSYILDENILTILDKEIKPIEIDTIIKQKVVINLDDFIQKNFTPTTIKVSSERTHKTNRYSFKNLTDTDLTTVWVAGGANRGINEKITIKFIEKKNIKAITLLNGYQLNDSTYQNNNRIKKLKVIYNGKETVTELQDTKEWQSIPINAETDTIDLLILDVYKGDKFVEDTCISEIGVEFAPMQ